MDRYVVGTVACEPVDFVDDAVRDLVRRDVLDHPHQLWPVGLARGLTRVDELLHDNRVQIAGLAEVRVALRGDRESLVTATALCLLLGGDTKVGDSEGGGLAEPVDAGGWCWGCQSHESCFLSPMGGSQRDGEASRGATRKWETRPPERNRGKPQGQRDCAPGPVRPWRRFYSTLSGSERPGSVASGVGASFVFDLLTAMPRNTCASLCKSG